MRRQLVALTLGLAFVVGCNSSEPGGPGAGGKKPVVGQGDNTFKLNAPTTETSVKQGESATVKIDISRGTNFDQDVKLEFSDTTPKGITLSPATSNIRASDKEGTTITIDAAKDAAVGHHTITVWGTPTREGSKTSVNLKVEVKPAS
jgi:uncharacterized membrane protein